MTYSERSLILGLVVVGIYCAFLPGLLVCQTTQSENLESHKAVFETKKGLDLDQWHSDVTFDRAIGSSGRLFLHQRLDVLLHQALGFHRQWKIDEKLRFHLRQPFTRSVQWIIGGEYKRFSDQRGQRFKDDVRYYPLIPNNRPKLTSVRTESISRDNDIGGWHLFLGAGLFDSKKLSLDGSIGPLSEQRGSRLQNGLRVKTNIDGGDFLRGVNGEAWLDRLNDGNDYGWSAVISGDYKLAGEATDKYSVRVSQNRQREHTIGGDQMSRRGDDRLHLNNRLSTGRSASWQLTWESDLVRQRSAHEYISSTYSDLDFNWRNGIDIEWQRGAFRGLVSGGVDLQEQQYAGRLMQGRRSRIGFGVAFLKSATDSIALKTSAMRYRFDTPDELDFNDRDELGYNIQLICGYAFSPRFGARLRLVSDLRQLVYLYRSRSGENRWERGFRLIVDLPWRDKPIDNIARFSVNSSFTDYNYSPSKESLSRIYRSFIANDSLNVALARGVFLRINLTGTIEDHGQLKWSEWIEDVSENGFSHTIAVMPSWERNGYSLGIGWNWHRRETELHFIDGESEVGESIRTHGPLLSLITPVDHRVRVELRGSVIVVKDRLRGSYRLPDVTCRLTWDFDRSINRRKP